MKGTTTSCTMTSAGGSVVMGGVILCQSVGGTRNFLLSSQFFGQLAHINKF